MLGLEPEKVYVHSGTRDGIRKLASDNLDWRRETIEMDKFPAPIRRKLSPREAEDFLCVYKDDLSREQKNKKKADLLYKAIDSRPDFYRSPVDKDSRSTMNVVFTLPTPELEADFLAGAQKQNMIGLKGHRSVGGIRASIYNAAELEWVQALVDYMNDFHKGA